MSTLPSEDAQRREYRRSARLIGVQVGAVVLALVVLGGVGAIGYLLWQATPGQRAETPEPGDVRISLNPEQITVALIIVGLSAVAAAGLAAWLIARRAVRPLDDAARTQRRFVADASHELRTPLAVMSARAQQLRALLDERSPVRPVADELRSDVTAMADIVDDMLHAGSGESPSVTADLALTMTAAANDIALIATAAEITITVATVDVRVTLGPARLKRCLIALLDNALSHAPIGSEISLSARTVEGAAVIDITDQGGGIRGIAPERVFDRFAHGEDAVRPGRTSTGIGLALVAEIAARSGGAAEVADSGPGGTTMRLRLPLAEGTR
ncbi:sensor histidine kinase [Microbacterium gorillae]|uniref:sensor histidine kinase n=1 Tax=Microbacterium gorillae TaxID=1231063 RepID=UPI0006937B06|nr:HAMP domain-containing sensor histidine kinase [Microbacterium gorillae]